MREKGRYMLEKGSYFCWLLLDEVAHVCLLRMRARVKAHVDGCQTEHSKWNSCCHDVWKWALSLFDTRDWLARTGLAGLGYWILLKTTKRQGKGSAQGDYKCVETEIGVQ